MGSRRNDEIFLHTARRTGDLAEWSQQVNTDIKTLALNAESAIRHINGILQTQEHEAEMSQHNAQIEATRAFLDQAHGHASTYSTVIIGAGYAGFFALWNMVDKSLAPWAHALSGILIGLSLLLFVGWETTKMIWTSVEHVRLQKLLVDGTLTWPAFQEALKTHGRRVGVVWVFFLVPTMAFGFSAGAVLLWHFVKRLVVVVSA